MSATSLDPYTGRYALRTRGMTASEIRALFAVASRPEVVSLAGGSPYTAALPLDAVGALLDQLVADQGAVALNYSTGQGDPRLREQICDVMSLVGITGSPDDVVVTVGSQQALDLIARVFLDPGDVVLAEAPSYVGALGTFASAQAEVAARRDGRRRDDPRRHSVRPSQTALNRVKESSFSTSSRITRTRPASRSAWRAASEILAIAEEADVLDRRGRPVRPARLRRRAVPGDARRRCRSCALPGHLQQDDRARPARRLGAGASRRPREAGARQRGPDPVPAHLQPAGRSRATCRPSPGWSR